MQALYQDKYMEELEKAKKEARIITKDVAYLIPAMRFVGIVQRGNTNTYYYHHESEDRYYSETDFDRYMRRIIKERKFQQQAKK